jgi:hypothetical protein
MTTPERGAAKEEAGVPALSRALAKSAQWDSSGRFGGLVESSRLMISRDRDSASRAA